MLKTHASAARFAAVGITAIILGSSVVRHGDIVALVAPMAVAILLLLSLTRALTPRDEPDTLNRILRWTLLGFGAHLLFGLAVTNVHSLATFFGGDAFTYSDGARGIVAHWTTGSQLPPLPGGREGFYYLIAGVYWVFGSYTAAGLVVNAALAAALVPLTTDLTRRLCGPTAARYAAPLVVLLPGLFLWTSQLLKEAPILFFFAVIANIGARMVVRLTAKGLLGLGVTAGFLLSFRGYVALAVVGTLLCAIALGKRSVSGGLVVVVASLAVVSLVVLAAGLGRSGYERTVNSDLAQVSSVRSDLARSAGSGFGQDVDVSTPQRALSFLPIGLVEFSLGPFPWQISGGRQLTAIPDVVVWWFLLPSLWRGHRIAQRRLGRGVLVLELPALAASIVLTLVIGNYGTVTRERSQVIILLMPLIALGLAERADRRRARLQTETPIPVVAGVAGAVGASR